MFDDFEFMYSYSLDSFHFFNESNRCQARNIDALASFFRETCIINFHSKHQAKRTQCILSLMNL